MSQQAISVTDLTVEIPSSSRSTSLPSERNRKPSRWGTLEFKFYFLVLLLALPLMIWIPMNLSNSSHPNYAIYHSRLWRGWLFGRDIDISDSQYRSFRNNIPVLAGVAALFLILKHAWAMLYSMTQAPRDSLHLIPFNAVFSILFLLGLHGSSAIKVIAVISANYVIAKSCKSSRMAPILTWVFNFGLLFLNDRYNGYRFGAFIPSLGFLDEEKYEGFYPRWYISFNITMLRLVSFSMDYYWACRQPGTSSETEVSLNERQRQTTSHPLEMYSYINYFAYALYSPLYIAGPIMTFNDFLWQFRRPLTITKYSVLGYLFRFIACLMTMEGILHFMYVVVIKDTHAWIGDTPTQIGMIGFWNLIIVCFCFLGGFFRLWALFDGIDPPENMVRCMANNYSTFGFWRSWHRSYNLWIIRYIYVPLGGMKNVFVNSVLVFTFVALWHDLTFKLLAWGWLVSLFILPEMLARYFLPPTRYSSTSWYRHVCALGGVVNILLMMTANLVGFVIGVDGVRFFLGELFGTFAGIQFLIGVVFCLFVGVQLMFEYREEEMRKGIYRRC
ncbi:MBOAT, membrane-bound O-acyltransferase family-domain-containing protein [Rhodocollybia butyracea]|uniref:MBOAT, membrane-bound O-acyltransferase family-domain-containing protein n=1 Tax=Rhodocollybia butyracea TaxID=206335 RepID=A0A9P5U0K8_9AGAR|nr:MBOAT, membrane-bound O-acyltransferase family-domain-containing protein [Rhodocollybia butyracea]